MISHKNGRVSASSPHTDKREGCFSILLVLVDILTGLRIIIGLYSPSGHSKEGKIREISKEAG